MDNLPHNAEAERAVLGAMLHKKDALLFVLEKLQTKDFYLPAHREIFVAMTAVDSSGKPVDEVTLVERLEANRALKKAGNVAYVTDLRAAIPALSNLPHYVEIVKEKAKRRELVAFADALKTDALGAKPLKEIIPTAADDLHNIGSDTESKPMVRLSDAMARAYFNLAAEEGTEQQRQNEIMRPGFEDIERYVPRFKAGQLIIIAARTSMGKSTLALNIGVNIAKKGGVVAMFSLEMDADEELAPKVMAAEGRTTIADATRGGNWEKLIFAQERLKDAEMWIDDTSGVTVPYIRSRLMRLIARTKKLDLVIIDYLQLLNSTENSKNATQNDRVAGISKSLKILARELAVPIIALSQLSRESEKRGTKPKLSDLRDSGAIEQDADIVMMLDRPKQSYSEVASLGILKNRNGGIGGVELWFEAPQSRFETLAQE